MISKGAGRSHKMDSTMITIYGAITEEPPLNLLAVGNDKQLVESFIAEENKTVGKKLSLLAITMGVGPKGKLKIEIQFVPSSSDAEKIKVVWSVLYLIIVDIQKWNVPFVKL
jgi:hypothetical protein